MHDCTQVQAFPPKPSLTDLIPRIKDAPEPLAEPISAEAIRILKHKRGRTRYYCKLDLPTSPSLSAPAGRSDGDGRSLNDPTLETKLSISNIGTARGTDDGNEMAGLEAAINTLRSKLEILQPDGMRPSDIAAVTAQTSAQDGTNTTAQEKDESTDNDVLLSQAATSQRSILLWDEICAIIEAVDSTNSRLQSMVSEVSVRTLRRALALSHD